MAGRSNFPSRVEKRKSDAKTRQDSYDKLTNEQKLIKTTVGSKEHNRLLAKVQK